VGNPKYPALLTIATFYRILAWITVAITIVLMLLGVIGTFISGQYIGGGIFGFLGQVLGGVLGSIVLVIVYGVAGFVVATLQLAVAEVLQVVMDIEANTRS
jgi:hypothetical protein